MTQTYSTPKEMLGYIVIQSMQKILEIIPSMPYDRRAVISFYQELRYIDTQLMTFREDMYLISEADGSKINYKDAMVEISKKITENYSNIYAKDFDEFLKAAYKWCELIASAYPKLGLVPETGEMSRMYKEENVIEDLDPQPEQDAILEEVNESPANSTPSQTIEPKSESKPSVHRTAPKPGFRFL